MGEQSIYTQIIESKTGCKIPLLANNRTVDSRYDPQRDSLRSCQSIKAETHFIILTGIASGILIQTILQNREDIFILAVEKSKAELEFLQQLELIQELGGNKRVRLCTVEQLKDSILELYVPAFYGSLEVIEQRGWTEENKELVPKLQECIQEALAVVSADFSVQSHFGKLWLHNIMCNLKQLDKAASPAEIKIDSNKTAVILGAGPTLEAKINELKANRNNYYIIATDTAFSIMCNNDMTPDCVVSLDGQNISGTHFIHSKEAQFKDTLFLFDLTSNPAAVRKALAFGGRLLFFISGHPLCSYINSNFTTGLPELFSGSGTVTISALDFAAKSGFKNILIFGADFAYVNGKSYAKGTYLDTLYNSQASRLFTLEKQFDRLLFRTPLVKLNEKSFTTSVLDSYRTSLEKYLETKGIGFIQKDDSYILDNSKNQADKNFAKHDQTRIFELDQKLADKMYNSIKNAPVPAICSDLSAEQICLLPLISWLRFYDNKKKEAFGFYLEKAADYYEKYLGRN
ncbi:MAG: motility associated factor glycosyltransferase family protein [Treponema sp.]|nr:motility associated factor glycosyltransferase family protein [Treponema sp.]